MQGEKTAGNRFVVLSVYIACILSNLSQLPFFVRSGMTQRLAFPGWILLMIAILLTRRVRLSKLVITIVEVASVFVAWCAFLTIVTRNNYFSSSLVYSFFLSLLMLGLGNITADNLSKERMKALMIIYVVTTSIVALVIFLNYFGIGYRLSSKLYEYSSKNSISQIICTSIIILITYLKPEKQISRIIRVFTIAFEVYVLLLLRSRATLVGLIICIIIMLLSKNIRKRTKAIIALIGVVSIVLLFASQSFYNFLFNGVLFAGRNINDLNELSSGRVAILQRYPELISNHWIEGIGSLYYESFPLSAILQFGLIGGLLLITVSLMPLASSIRKRNSAIEWEVLFYISIGFSINGLFEGLTPFGPGIKCYIIWFLYGVLLKGELESAHENIAYNHAYRARALE